MKIALGDLRKLIAEAGKPLTKSDKIRAFISKEPEKAQEMTLQQIADMFGASKQLVSMIAVRLGVQREIEGQRPNSLMRSIPDDELRLMTNDELVKKYDTSNVYVSQIRYIRGIKSPVGQGAPEKYDWSVVPFGRVSDSEISRRLGVSANTVNSARRRLGIFSSYKRGMNITTQADRELADQLFTDELIDTFHRR